MPLYIAQSTIPPYLDPLPQPRPTMPPAHEVYATQLWPLRHGRPLWGPEPSPQYGEIRIEDIGYLKAGYFFFLFNCMRGEDDIVNSYMGSPRNSKSFGL